MLLSDLVAPRGLAAALAAWRLIPAIGACTLRLARYLARLMLSGLALFSLLAWNSAAGSPTVAAEVTTSELAPLPPRFAARSPFSRAQLAFGSSAFGGFASSLTTSFGRWSVGLGLEGQTLSAPSRLPGSPTSDGLLVSKIGYGVYLGHAPSVRAELFPYKEYVAAKPSLSVSGPQIKMDGSFFFTKTLGIRLEVSGGTAMYGGISLIYRPKW